MSPLAGKDAYGATPLDDESLEGLIPTHVATRADLNLAEQANIEGATLWAFRRGAAVSVDHLLTVSFAFEVHRRMFGDVWEWAGQQRPRELNIGIEPIEIPAATKSLLDDAKYWHDHDVFDARERAARLHLRLVQVHPFRNGNGRHARFMADLYLHAAGLPRLTWGGDPLDFDTDARRRYISALQAADRGDIAPLLAFADA
jgi:Fic-DOC domain mobile mystery protein B